MDSPVQDAQTVSAFSAGVSPSFRLLQHRVNLPKSSRDVFGRPNRCSKLAQSDGRELLWRESAAMVGLPV